MQDAAHLDVGTILNDAAAALGSRPLTFAAAGISYAAFGIWVDQQIWSWRGDIAMTLVDVLFGGLLQFLVLSRLLGSGGGWGGALLAMAVAVAIHVVLSLAIGLGYILLLVPGLYLAGRMSAAVGMVIAERTGPFSGIAGSWHRTRASVWPLVLVHGLLLFPLLALMGAILAVWYAEYGTEFLDESAIEFAFITNLAFGVMTMAGWAVAGAVYRLTAPDRRGIDDVFA